MPRVRLLLGLMAVLTAAAGFGRFSFEARAADVQEPAAAGAPLERLEEVVISARRRPENAQNVPVAVTVLSAERLAQYRITSLESLAEFVPNLILTRGNSGSGLDISLRGIGPNFSSIGIEQSVAIVVDDVYYGQGRIIDESFVDLDQIQVLKGPQALFFGKNSTAGVIAITTASPTAKREIHGRIAYEFATADPQAELIVSGPLTDELGLRFVVSGQHMRGGYVHNTADPGSYTTIDAATFAPALHAVPAPLARDLPREHTAYGRLTVVYRPIEALTATIKASLDRDTGGGTSWNDRLWKCPAGHPSFPGAAAGSCGEGFEIAQNPAPPDIAATRHYLGWDAGQLYTRYQSRAITGNLEAVTPVATVTSVSNYQYFDYATTSDYDFTSSPTIWADQYNDYRAVSEELRASTRLPDAVDFVGGLYYQSTRLNFAQAAEFFGAESTAAAPQNRYVSVLKQSATDGETFSGYGQLIWRFHPGWELASGARYTYETKDSFFVQPYVNPFFVGLYAPNVRLVAHQHFHDASPEATLTWQMSRGATLYAAYKTGYKSGGFSNSADAVVNSAGSQDLSFKPETAQGFEAGLKATVLQDTLRLALEGYRYRFNNLQVDFFNPLNFALITTNAGAAVSAGAEAQAQYLPPQLKGWRLRGTVGYNAAHYARYLGPCYAGQTQVAGCRFLGPPPDLAHLQDLNGKPTADSPKWTGSLGAEYDRPISGKLLLGCTGDLRFSSRYAVSPFAQPFAFQSGYVNVDASLRVATVDGHWQLALVGKNLTNNFVVTYASDAPATGTPPGGQTGIPADQLGLFAPARTVELGLTYRR